MNTTKDRSISFVRFVAMVFIVACHFMQHYDFVLAWWFNAGVQMFLFLSGYLYSGKRIDDIALFYKRNALKLLVDYYIYIAFILVVILMFGKIEINSRIIFHMLILKSFPSEIGQFWFLPYILFCYGVTPAWIALLDSMEKKDGFKYIVSVGALLILMDLIIRNFLAYFEPAWIICYVLGMLVYRMEKNKRHFAHMYVLCLLMNGVQIYVNYFSDFQMEGDILRKLWSIWCNYAHVLLGASLVILLRQAYRSVKRIPKWFHRILNWSDTYSYDIYIVHNVYIQGAYSVLVLFAAMLPGMILAVALIILSAIILNRLSNYCKKAAAQRMLRLPVP